MKKLTQIEIKLKQFSSKFYTNELIKGIILFTSLGLLYLFFTLFLELFLWLKPIARTILFWLFIGIELFLFIRFIGFPILKLIGLKKGISYEESSKIIGLHFPEVKDKLLNFLQLKEKSTDSDLLLASIEQKAQQLEPIAFTKAINFKTNTKYLKYIAIPVLIWLLSLLTGIDSKLSQSFNRVVNHSTAFAPPAPFTLNLTANELNVIQGKPFTIYIEARGEVIPQEAKIIYNNQQYLLTNEGAGYFSYTFSEVIKPINFYIQANTIQSKDYKINIIEAPLIQNVSMQLIYPGYLNKKSEKISSTGNITIPQGTSIKWNIKTFKTDSLHFITDKKRYNFNKNSNDKFEFQKSVHDNLSYKITSSNNKLKDYESLQYRISVIKDEYPVINIKSNIDSVSRGPAYFAGQISDDYGLQKLQLVYYNSNNPINKEIKNIEITKESVQTFFYEFPKGLDLKEGIDYEMYFEIFDNDFINKYKKTVSKKFSYQKKTNQEVEEELLDEQKDYINSLENSLEKQQKAKKDLEKIQFDLQNKKEMNWNDQKKIKNLLDRQEKHQQMMQQQTQKLQENFSEKKEETEELQEQKENLKKRVEELKKIDKQKKLLEELFKMAEKLNKEELVKKTKELAEQNKQQEKSLERVLEMTKRFYVQQKQTQLANKLNELSKKQEELSKKNSSEEEQNKIKKEFEKTQDELKELQKDNEALKEPMDLPDMDSLKKEAEDELNKAAENLKDKKQQAAKNNQKKAADKMKKMASKMEQAMEMMSDEMQEENEEDLRQVLENLITFSFDQENLMEKFESLSDGHPNFGKHLKKQHQLKTYFEHIDDSLFVLSMRVPKISAEIQEHIGNAHYNLDQSLENFAETRFGNGISNQRYIMTSANELVHMLSNSLDNMKNGKPGSGKGKGKGESFSLPDIIKKQSDILKKMKEGLQKKGKSGEPKKPGENGEPKDGEGGKKGKSGKGKKGKGEGDLDGELYQIYKEQSRLRQELEDAIKKGANGNGKSKAIKALKTMEDLEKQILEKGFTKEILNRMQKLNYELLKLEKANFKQGKDEKRKANSNSIEYNKNSAKQLEFKKLFYNQTEILNRQSLPLQHNYKKKVKEYFIKPNSTVK